MNILITGSNGFLGQHLVNNLIKSHNVETLNRSGLCNHKINLANTIPDFKSKFDIVIHAAGKAHTIPRNIKQENDFFNININGTKNLLSGLEKNSIPSKLVFISSVSVYGLVHGELVNENFSLNALDPYGLSKIKAESVVQEWCKKNNVKCTIFRLPLILGKNPPGNLGSMIKGIQFGYYFNINGGSAKKSMVLSSDIAKFILIASEIGGIYNLTDGYHPTFFELSHYIANQMGRNSIPNLPSFFASYLAKFGDIFGTNFPLNTNKYLKITSDLTFDDSKARKAFGWSPIQVLGNFLIS